MTLRNMLTNPARQVIPMDDAALRRVAPSIFTDRPMPGMSERYAFIPTAPIVEGLRAAGFVPIRAAEGRARLDDRRDYMRHVITFRHRDRLDFDRTVGRDLTAERGHAWLEGGDVLPEIVMDNAHDGSGAYRLMMGLFRLACLNGLIVSDGTFAAHSIRHVGAATAGKVVDAAFHVIEQAPQIMDKSRQWGAIQLPDPARVGFATAAAELRWGTDDNQNVAAPIRPESLLRAQRFGDNGGDLWRVFNRVQENLTKGGLQGRGKTGRRLTTRAVNAPAENVRINRRLWELAEGVAKLVQAPPAGHGVAVAAE